MNNLITRFDEAIGKAVSDLPAENPAKRFELLQSIRSQAASFCAVPESVQTELLAVTIYFVQNDAKTLESLDSLLRMALHQVDLYATETPKSEPFHSAPEAEPRPDVFRISPGLSGLLQFAVCQLTGVETDTSAFYEDLEKNKPEGAGIRFTPHGVRFYGDPTPTMRD